jgi:hypothetical protein
MSPFETTVVVTPPAPRTCPSCGGGLQRSDPDGSWCWSCRRLALLAVADIVTLARTGVDYDYRGDVIDSHAPEMPTRFAKQLAQLMRGALALGMSRAEALRLAMRCARDSVPPLRLAILLDVAAHPHTTTHAVRQRLEKPRATVDRQLQSLHILGLLRCDEEPGERGNTAWHYSVGDGVDPSLLEIGTRNVIPYPYTLSKDKQENEKQSLFGCGDISGTYEEGVA